MRERRQNPGCHECRERDIRPRPFVYIEREENVPMAVRINDDGTRVPLFATMQHYRCENGHQWSEQIGEREGM